MPGFGVGGNGSPLTTVTSLPVSPPLGADEVLAGLGTVWPGLYWGFVATGPRLVQVVRQTSTSVSASTASPHCPPSAGLALSSAIPTIRTWRTTPVASKSTSFGIERLPGSRI